MTRTVDAVIVGQGLAGTTLALHLQQLGWSVAVLDRGEVSTSSRIAAGLITPITGKRLNLAEGYGERDSEARSFYTKLERRTGTRFFFDLAALRVLMSDEERLKWAERRELARLRPHLMDPDATFDRSGLTREPEMRGFLMRAGQLDVATCLSASRQLLVIETREVDWRKDVELSDDAVQVGPYRAKYAIACEGFHGATNPYFDWVPFRAAKGEILTVRFAEPLPRRAVHGDIWVAPTSEPDTFKVGATYEWHELDNIPTAAARRDLEDRLRKLIHVPYSVIDHGAAVRPIISGSNPVIGVHPRRARLACFNGLGSKGALLAPWYARHLAAHLVHGQPLDPDFDLRRRFNP